MILFAVKNDKGEWLYSDEYNDWVDQLSQATFYDTFEDADDDIECWELSNAYVVELVEAPEKVVVNEKEASLLEKMADGTNFNGERGFEPGLVITNFVLNNPVHGESHFETEDRLMRAYVNGWTVEKPKRYIVLMRLPGKKGPDDNVWHYMRAMRSQQGDYIWWSFADADGTCKSHRNDAFTAAEIEHYGLQDCERIPVAD
jgi:hypothetical protein